MDIRKSASYLLESQDPTTKEYKVKDAKFVFSAEDEDYGVLSYKAKDSYGDYKIYFDNGGAYGFTASIEKEMLEKLYNIVTSKDCSPNKVRSLLEIGKGAKIQEAVEDDTKFVEICSEEGLIENTNQYFTLYLNGKSVSVDFRINIKGIVDVSVNVKDPVYYAFKLIKTSSLEVTKLLVFIRHLKEANKKLQNLKEMLEDI